MPEKLKSNANMTKKTDLSSALKIKRGQNITQSKQAKNIKPRKKITVKPEKIME